MRTRQGPDDFNGYGYFFVRLFSTGLGFQANIVEEYVLLSPCVLRGPAGVGCRKLNVSRFVFTVLRQQ